jgi:hypothetical protein
MRSMSTMRESLPQFCCGGTFFSNALGQDAINNTVGWMHVFSLLGGGVPWGVPWLFSGVGGGRSLLNLKGLSI